MYVKTKGGVVQKFPYFKRDIAEDFANVSFPKSIGDGVLAEYGIFPVAFAPDPDHDPVRQKIVSDNAPTLVNGIWVVQKTAVDMSEFEQSEHSKVISKSVRFQRDRLLQETDWMALSDVTMEPYWREYRQQLRDITAQEGFPFNVVWPTKPE